MELKVSPWVNSKSYLAEKVSSVSFVENLKEQVLYVFKGILSDLWISIIETGDYQKVKEFAITNGIESDLCSYLSELKKSELIISDVPNVETSKQMLPAPVSKKIKNYVHFEKIQTKIASERNLISTLYLVLGYDCNLNCKHCCNPKNEKQQKINYDSAKKIIDEAASLGVSEICLTGGEATINKDFLKIAEYVRHKHLKLHVFTNCQKLHDDDVFFDKLVSLYPSVVQISLYSMNSQIHDSITKVQGSCQKVIEVIKKLRNKNIDVLVTCFQMSYNSGEDDEVKKFAKSVGAQFLSACSFINNIDNDNICAKLSEDDIKNFYIKNINKKNIRDKFIKCDEPICSAGLDKICVTPNFDVTPCIYMDYKLGNLQTSSLVNIKQNILPDFRKKFIISNLTECFNYDYCEYCNFCPTYPSNEGNDFMAKSDILCEDAKIYKEVLNLKKFYKIR